MAPRALVMGGIVAVSDGMGFDEGPPPFGQGARQCSSDAFRPCALNCADTLGGFSTVGGTRCMKDCEQACDGCAGRRARDQCMALE